MRRKLCESERNYRTLEHEGILENVIGCYALGMRGSDILDTLATARVWSHNFGEWVPCPVGYDRTTWNDILDSLVMGRLGDRRCLSCGGFFRTTKVASVILIGPSGRTTDYRCPHCGGTAHDVIGCTKGVV